MTAPIGCLDEREAFEAWAGDQGFVLTRTVHGDEYQDLRTQGPWDAWQAHAALSASRQEGETQIFTRVSELMRAIDAYAYDYQLHGKLAASRHTVQIAIYDALNQSQEAQGDRHGE